MLPKTNIEQKLLKLRQKRIGTEAIFAEVERIFSENEVNRQAIRDKLSENNNGAIENLFDIEKLDRDRIYHIDDIQKICVTYRLRFLDSHFFKGIIPEEAISKIRSIEKEHHLDIQNFQIVAPAKLLKLENADDPLLFAPISNGYYYLVHKWGKDLHPLRKIMMWPYKSFENLVFMVFVLSIFLTAITPMQIFTKHVSTQEYILLFLFMFKAVAGLVLYYGFAKGKNFNSAIWDSRYYNG